MKHMADKTSCNQMSQVLVATASRKRRTRVFQMVVSLGIEPNYTTLSAWRLQPDDSETMVSGVGVEPT
jgi:hypothetical protein